MRNPWIILAIAAGAFLVLRAAMGGPSAAERKQASEKIKQGARILDVRTPDEFAGGHYPGATNIPVHELQGRLREVGPTNKTVIVYCRSGARSSQAKAILEAAGFTDVINAGGLSDLKKAAP